MYDVKREKRSEFQEDLGVRGSDREGKGEGKEKVKSRRKVEEGW